MNMCMCKQCEILPNGQDLINSAESDARLARAGGLYSGLSDYMSTAVYEMLRGRVAVLYGRVADYDRAARKGWETK